ncbi:putative uncharacterized protein DDB_G0282133 [Teleopsis dalmanni]|uniref:putative uncharacterized protein DDB_G0282133 n=1 Tax=Teleopsis dalmanni TaxID=139649 RepID=UPI0018CE7553|nr:putative uncharacterized protein DDB_G0282133 [Teleopsis dalmanni]
MSISKLSVVGEHIKRNEEECTRLTLQRVFNTSLLLKNPPYRHEIANHYRDLKYNPHIRRRRRKVFVRNRNPAAVGVFTEFRQLLPLAVQHFPRFAITYTPRGRRTLCENAPPDETFNDTVRRIRAASGCEELKALVQRQLEFRTSTTQRHNKYNKYGQKVYEKPVKWRFNYSRNNYNHNNKGHCEKLHWNAQIHNNKKQQLYVANKFNDSNSNSKSNGNDNTNKINNKKRNNNDLNYYLELASELYQKGFLYNIKYLESIGKRNNNSLRHRTKDILDGAHTSSTTRTIPTFNNICIKTTETCERPTKQDYLYNCANLVEILERAETKQDTTELAFSENEIINKPKVKKLVNRTQFKEWPIRVDITPATSTSNCQKTKTKTNHITPSPNQETFTTTTESGDITVNHHSSDWIMNGFLNANSQHFSKIYSSNINQTSSKVLNLITDITDTRDFHDFIDHFSGLDITDKNTNVPKIILTDCSSIPSAGVSSNLELESNYINCTPNTYNTKSFCLKEASFNQNLCLPNELLNSFHSEARPP